MWFWVIVVMSSVQLQPSSYCPVFAVFLGVWSDNPAVDHFKSDLMLALSFYWLFGNAVVNVVTLCCCICANQIFPGAPAGEHCRGSEASLSWLKGLVHYRFGTAT
jgi:hypothetical protein